MIMYFDTNERGDIVVTFTETVSKHRIVSVRCRVARIQEHTLPATLAYMHSWLQAALASPPKKR